jgi:hypothetical protein
MNYFGHCAVASWFDGKEAAPFGFGAMLPDFVLMARAKLASPATSNNAIADGIDLHHRTDAAFHHQPAVLALMRELSERLAHYGCARGPARAVAHIGVELLLDAVWTDDETYARCYQHAIATDVSQLHWDANDDVDGATAMQNLQRRLIEFGVPRDLQRTDSIVHRMHRMLIDRPRLAPSASDLVAIGRAVDDQRMRCQIAAPTVLRSVRATLQI